MCSSKDIFGSNQRGTTSPPSVSVVPCQTRKPWILINWNKASPYNSTISLSSSGRRVGNVLLVHIRETNELATLTYVRVPMSIVKAITEWVELILRITAVHFWFCWNSCSRTISSSGTLNRGR